MQRKAFDKIQCSVTIRTLNKMALEDIYLNIIKKVYEEPTANTHTGESLKAFPLRQGTRLRVS